MTTSYPPFTYAVTTDPVSGIEDGIMKRPATDPLVMQIDSGNEFWNMQTSLNVSDGAGHPVPIPANVRYYFMTGFQHIGGNPKADIPSPANAAPSDKELHICQYGTNPHYHGFTARALLVALDQWADQGIEPPASRYPGIQADTLLSLADYRTAFPVIPGVPASTVVNQLELLGFGHSFTSQGGRLTTLPPFVGASYKILVPKPDADGIDVAGIRPLQTRAPLGTSLGWNIRAEGQRAPNLCALSGSFIPFAATKTERIAKGDSRLSLEERYKDHAGYVQAVKQAADDLVKERFLLQDDATLLIGKAEQEPSW
jgi:hypothetical protein